MSDTFNSPPSSNMDPKAKELPPLVAFNGEETVYQCPYCSRAPRGFDNLKLHMTLAHNTKRILSCTYCSYQTLVEQNLINHKREVHPNLSKYTCDHCNFQTWDALGYSRHKCSMLRDSKQIDGGNNQKITSESEIPTKVPSPSNSDVPDCNTSQKSLEVERQIAYFSQRKKLKEKNRSKPVSNSKYVNREVDNPHQPDTSGTTENKILSTKIASPQSSKQELQTPPSTYSVVADNNSIDIDGPSKFNAPKLSTVNGKIKIKLKPQVNSAVISTILKKSPEHSDAKKRPIEHLENSTAANENQAQENGEGSAEKSLKLINDTESKTISNADVTNNIIYTCDHCQYVTSKLSGKIMRDSIVTLGLNVHVRKMHGEEFSNNQDKKWVSSLFCVTKNRNSMHLSVWKVRLDQMFPIISRILEAQKIFVQDLIQMVTPIIGAMDSFNEKQKEYACDFTNEDLQRIILVSKNSVTSEKEFFHVFKNMSTSLLDMLEETNLELVNENQLRIFINDMIQGKQEEKDTRSCAEMVTAQ